jgi:ABC-type amino acid transport substrate-binding protein
MGLILADALSNILLKPISLQTVLYEEKNPLGPLDSAIDALEAGEVDAIWNFAWTVGRTQRLGLSCWYDEPADWSVVTKGNLTLGDAHPTDLSGWTKSGGAGIKVGTLPGTITGEVNSLYFPNAELVPYDDQQALLAGLNKGEVDLTLANKGTVDFYKSSNANSTLVVQPNTSVNYGGGAVLITRKN